ncbi:hypothetical protein C8F04DRAFT_483421 [Mycena alexandri]|uniref:Zn(2)-C6 fungal-type domain-containing protein n=1 Tax=Mycena alexandri TaxID=1745969 RepID=A0AAD6WVC5_9AGAR|nr:hypothetical protein C8F04DRAFT_152302 [Mycena alexandri]KAJ7036279.1 hypothetical protein C8F04DRAFT_483421 [Mycena alexandri]
MSSVKPAKFKTPTCVLCRRRKLRCDGGEPCGPCSRTRTPVTCTYVPKTVGQLRSELPKGGACITCRQRKRRCDGNFPCRTCIQTSRPDECKYRERAPGKQKPPKPAPREHHFSSDSASTSSSSSRPTTPSQPVSLQPGALRIQDEYPDLHSSSDHLFPWSELNPMCLPSYSGDSTCTQDGLYAFPPHDSIFFPTPSLNTLPQDFCAERFSVRNHFLEHAWQYGLSIPAEKRQALAIGDLSRVDPTLVDVCELLGYLQRVHSHPEGWLSFNGQTTAEADLDGVIRDTLEGSSGLKLDPLLQLQCYALLSIYSAQKEDICGFQRQLAKAGSILVHHAETLGLADTQAVDWSPQFDTSYLSPHSVVEETRAVFSQIIFLDIASVMIINLPSVIDPALLEKFRGLAAVHWNDTEINFLRAKSLLFLSDSQQLVAAWRRWEFGDPAPTAWSKRFWSLVDEIHSHINFLNTAVMDVSCIPALQELHGLFAPSQLESQHKHLEAVTEIINITRGFADKDYEFLDHTVGICWSIASRALYDGGWTLQGSRGAPNDTLSQASLVFLHECNRKLRRAGVYIVQL